MSTNDPLKLAIYLQAIDDTAKATDSAVSNMGRVEESAKKAVEQVQAMSRGGFADASKALQQDFIGAIGAARNSPSVDIIPKGAISELNGFKSAVESLKRDFSDIATKAGSSIDLDSSLAKRLVEGHRQTLTGLGEAAARASDDLKKMDQSVAESATGLEKNTGLVSRLSEVVSKHSKQLIGLGGLIGGALAVKAVGGWVSDAISDVAKLGDEINKIMQKTGLGAKEVGGLKFLAEQTDVSLTTLAQAINKLGGGQEGLQALKDLNAEIDRAGTQKEKIDLASQALSKLSKSMIGALTETPAAFNKMLEDGERLYGMADRTAKAADAYNDAIQKLSVQGSSFKIKVAGPIVEGLSQILTKTNELIDQHGVLAGALLGAGYAELKMIDKVTGSNLAGDDIDKLSKKANELFNRAAAARKELQKLNDMPIGTRAGFGSLDIKTRTIKAQEQAIADLRRQLVETVKIRDDLIKAGEDGAAGLAQGLKSGTKKVTAAAAEVGRAAEKGARDALKTHSPSVVGDQIGKDFGEGLAQGIESMNSRVAEAAADLAASVNRIIEDLEPARAETARFQASMDLLSEATMKGVISLDRFEELSAKLATGKAAESMASVAERGRDEMTDLQRAVEGWGRKASDTFSAWATGAKVSIADVAATFAREMIAMAAYKSIFEPLAATATSFLGSLFGNANGGVYSSAGLSAYSGQVVDRPTLFPFARGIGLMGEAGPEAILPSARSSDGRLGVQGGAASVTVNLIESPGSKDAGTTRARQGSNGEQIIDVIVDRIRGTLSREIARGEGLAVPIESRYGLNAAAGAWR